MPDDTQIDLRQTVAELRRQLEARTIERDEALVREAANEERYALVTQAVAEGIYEWHIQSNSLWVSPRLIEIFGLAEHSLTAADWNSLVHPEDFPLYRAALRACFKGVTPRLDCEYRVRHSDGGYRWIEDRGVPVRDATGWAIRMVGALTDVSPRKAADEGLREALEQQTATAEVLQVINSSPGQLAPVFEKILDKAVGLCEAAFGSMLLYNGERFDTVAVRGVPAAFADYVKTDRPMHGPGTGPARILAGERVVHITDLAAEEPYRSGDPQRRALVDLGGARSLVCVPLLRDGAVLGIIVVYRQEVRPFSQKQIALLQNFAAQTVIAMENARLLTETREALEQQTATAEVLQVINSSPGDLAPVFDAILEKAHALCGVQRGSLQLFDGDCFRAVATRFPQEAEVFAERLRQGYPASDTPVLQPLRGGVRFVYVPDLAEVDDPVARAAVAAGTRSILYVPLRRDDAFFGMIVAAREEIRPFTDKEIVLLESFAAQAVIAMDNARLLTETREALEQQTATAEVLQVINSSPGELTPVFEAMLEKAMRLCGAFFGELRTFDGERFRLAATHGVPTPYVQHYARGDRGIYGPGTGPARILAGERVVHIPDLVSTEPYQRGDPDRVALVELGGARAYMLVPLLKDTTVLGYIMIYRKDAGSFSEKQIALLQNFAAQAVIAMENARLLGELRKRTEDLQESLKYQTATSNVLQVISRSTFDLRPILDTLIETAARLCNAEMGLIATREDDAYRATSCFAFSPEWDAAVREIRFLPGRGSVIGRSALERHAVHVSDIAADPEYALPEVIAVGKMRTALGVPLLRDGEPIGVVYLARQRVDPFTDRQIALVRTFADQAVIAIENARLLNELRDRTRDLQESLEYQTATSDVLKVISRSTFDLQPVLATVAETAARLCEAEMAYVLRRDGEVYRAAAAFGLSPESMASAAQYQQYLERNPITPGRGTLTGRVAMEGRAVQIADVAADPEYSLRQATTLGKIRTQLGVPLMREDSQIGVIILSRQVVQPFTEKQIELATTFADQAVIAIENARLLNELQDRTRDLEESLEYQTATSDVLKVISRSTFDLQPVLDTLVESAARLCEADSALISNREGAAYRVAATFSFSPEYDAFIRGRLLKVDRNTMTGRTVLAGRVVHIADIASDPEYAMNETREIAKIRTMLGVPLLREAAVIGTINLGRQRVEPFTDRQIELVSTFADQAVIAIENARLLNELRDRTDELTRREAELRVTFDNMGDGVAMFDSELRLAAWNRNFQELLDLPDAFLAERPRFAEYFRYLAKRGEYSGDLEAQLSRGLEDAEQEMRFERTRPDGRVIEVRRNAVPRGGLVMIYSDITERKRAEAEIRAARDAAETTLAELRTTQASLLHAQKMAALGQLTAGIAHEIKNPLNFVNNFADLSVELLDELKETTEPAVAALGGETRAEIDEIVEMLTANLGKIAEHGRRADGIVKSMLAHSRGSSGERQQVDINALVEEALNLAYHGARAQDQNFNITLECELDRSTAPIELVPQDVTRVFLNLFGNGFYAANKRRSEGGEPQFKPTLKVTTHDRGAEVEIRVRDNGIGIAPGAREKLFQPFFTTKPTGEGTGLGLSISYDIVTQEHGGTIEVDSELGAFTEFTIRLPRSRQATTTGSAA